ncbi:MAG TPA: hypothetical protein V6C65_37690, partial [Allocoleopsis sp.]
QNPMSTSCDSHKRRNRLLWTAPGLTASLAWSYIYGLEGKNNELLTTKYFLENVQERQLTPLRLF